MRKLLLVCLVLVLLYSCFGCGKAPSPYEVLQTLSTLYPLPDGIMYDSMAEVHEQGYFDPALFTLLYGRGEGDDDREDVARFALFFGSSPYYTYEIGIFECYDHDGIKEVLGFIETRKLLLSTYEEYQAVGSEMQVCLIGKRVVYVVLPEGEKAMRVIKRLYS